MKKIFFALATLSLTSHLYCMMSSRDRYRQEVEVRRKQEIKRELEELIFLKSTFTVKGKFTVEDANKPMFNGRTPLYNAIDLANYGLIDPTWSIKLVNRLLSRGADLRIKSGLCGDAPLHLAIGRLPIVEMLLSTAVERNQLSELLTAKNDLGDAALHHAIKSKRLMALHILIDKGSDVHQKAGNNNTVLETFFFDVDWKNNEGEALCAIFSKLVNAGAPISREIVAHINDPKNIKMLYLCKAILPGILKQNTQTFLASIKPQQQPNLYLEMFPAEIMGEVRNYFAYGKATEPQEQNLSTPEKITQKH